MRPQAPLGQRLLWTGNLTLGADSFMTRVPSVSHMVEKCIAFVKFEGLLPS
jgi:hypothetical protein